MSSLFGIFSVTFSPTFPDFLRSSVPSCLCQRCRFVRLSPSLTLSLWLPDFSSPPPTFSLWRSVNSLPLEGVRGTSTPAPPSFIFSGFYGTFRSRAHFVGFAKSIPLLRTLFFFYLYVTVCCYHYFYYFYFLDILSVSLTHHILILIPNPILPVRLCHFVT